MRNETVIRFIDLSAVGNRPTVGRDDDHDARAIDVSNWAYASVQMLRDGSVAIGATASVDIKAGLDASDLRSPAGGAAALTEAAPMQRNIDVRGDTRLSLEVGTAAGVAATAKLVINLWEENTA